ncbi:uncharacterized protein LOC122399901 [Colletes gigas]|uniref:uncharacterized protein LOC122399901 n=1 Tax=Colletes gigas TaxID=935657 RepID=UPI001C9A659A|nr:uncharacterized protein LOC122399901 [Colletes gigas]
MAKSNERRVKSLNDIAEVFKTCDNRIVSNESKIPKLYLTNAAKRFNKSDQSMKGTLVSRETGNEKARNDFRKKEEDRMKKLEEKPKSLKVDVNDRLENCSKTSPLDAPNSRISTLVFGKKLNKQKRILATIDIFLSMVLITPLTVGFWRGIWTLMDLHAEWFPGAITFLSGILVHTNFAILKNFLHDRVAGSSRKKTCSSNIVSKLTQILYTYIFGVACNMHWRGGWIIFDYFFGGYIWATVITMLVILTCLAILRSIRNIIAVPTAVFVDKRTYAFWFPTRYKLNIYNVFIVLQTSRVSDYASP